MNDSNIQLIHGDSLDELQWLDENSVDAVVTDPPYGLGKEPDALVMLKAWTTTGRQEVKGSGFMGKEWDAFVPQPALWKEIYRVLKPGGHVVSFFGSRTYDLGVLAMRIAGFEIRDTIAWLYGSGFPKSLNISKAIDKEAGAKRTAVKHAARPGMSKSWDEKGTDKGRSGISTVDDNPITPEAAQWQGYGTALKPSLEPICLARKPISENTISANVLKWGTGALNIDGCRVGDEVRFNPSAANKDLANRRTVTPISETTGRETTGRWPANTVHDGGSEVELEFAKFGDVGGGDGKPHLAFGIGGNGILHGGGGGAIVQRYADSGSAARFFYTAKACKADRNGGSHPEIQNLNPTVKPISLMRWLCRLITPKGGTVLDPFLGSGTTGLAAIIEGFKFIGIELEAESYAVAHSRITGAKLDDPQYQIERILVKGEIQTTIF